MNKVENAVIESFCEITGLDEDSAIEARSLDLFENKILDSLSLVNLINEIEEKLDIEIDFTQYKIEELSFLDEIIGKVDKLYNS